MGLFISFLLFHEEQLTFSWKTMMSAFTGKAPLLHDTI